MEVGTGVDMDGLTRIEFYSKYWLSVGRKYTR